MGRAHSMPGGRRPVFDLPADIRMVAICGRDHAAMSVARRRRSDGKGRFTIGKASRPIQHRYRGHLRLTIRTPRSQSRAARAGKAILCEPLARNSAEARRMVDAVKRSRVPNMVCFNYRRLPAVALAKEMIDAGEIGDRIYHGSVLGYGVACIWTINFAMSIRR